MRDHPLPEICGSPMHRRAFAAATRLVVGMPRNETGGLVAALAPALGRAVIEAAAVGAVVSMVVARGRVTDELEEIVTATLESQVDEASEDVVTLALDLVEQVLAELRKAEVAA